MPTNFTAPGLRGNSRPQRLKIAEPSGRKSRGADRRVVNREQQTGSAQTRTALGVQVSPRRPFSGMPTGQANRACLLNSACLRASGASPRHSAILGARSSKRAGGFITRIALDECLDPERYRTRVPFPLEASQSSQRSGRFHKPAVPRAALGIATTSPPCGSPQASFVSKSRRGGTGRRLQPFRSRSPTAETRRRERRQCRRESCREHPLGLQALK